MHIGASNREIARLVGVTDVAINHIRAGRAPGYRIKRRYGSIAKLGARQMRRAVLNPYAWRKWLEHRDMPRKK